MFEGEVIYENQRATRNKKLNPEFEALLKRVSKKYGFDVRVASGGQPATGPNRVGGQAHNHGNAGDVDILDKDGKPIDIETNFEKVKPFFTDLYKEGVKGFGYGKKYMGTSRVHLDVHPTRQALSIWGEDKTRKSASPLFVAWAEEVGGIPRMTSVQYRSPDYTPGTIPRVKMIDRPADFYVGRSPYKYDPMKTDTKQGKYTKLADLLAKFQKRTGSTTGTGKKGPSLASELAPYISNIYNATLKPAPVPKPVMNKPIQLQRVRMDADRYANASAYRGLNNSYDMTMDGNTSAAAKLVNKAQYLGRASQINEQERNANTQIANSEVTTNAGIDQANNEKVYQYRTLEADRFNTIQSMRSANLSNAADKFTARQNTKAEYELEDRKIKYLMNNDPYGVMKAFMEKQKNETGIKQGKFGGNLYPAKRMFTAVNYKPAK